MLLQHQLSVFSALTEWSFQHTKMDKNNTHWLVIATHADWLIQQPQSCFSALTDWSLEFAPTEWSLLHHPLTGHCNSTHRLVMTTTFEWLLQHPLTVYYNTHWLVNTCTSHTTPTNWLIIISHQLSGYLLVIATPIECVTIPTDFLLQHPLSGYYLINHCLDIATTTDWLLQHMLINYHNTYWLVICNNTHQVFHRHCNITQSLHHYIRLSRNNLLMVNSASVYLWLTKWLVITTIVRLRSTLEILFSTYTVCELPYLRIINSSPLLWAGFITYKWA